MKYIIYIAASVLLLFNGCEKDDIDFDCESFNVEITQFSCSSFTFTHNSPNGENTEMMVNGEFFDGGHPAYDWTAPDAGIFNILIIYEGPGCPNATTRTLVVEIPEDCFQ